LDIPQEIVHSRKGKSHSQIINQMTIGKIKQAEMRATGPAVPLSNALNAPGMGI
jgi:hypothetical protein